MAPWLPTERKIAGAAYNGQTGVEMVSPADVVLGQKVVEVRGGMEVVGMEVLGMEVGGRQVGGHVQMDKKPRQVAMTVGKAARPCQSSSSSRGKRCGK